MSYLEEQLKRLIGKAINHYALISPNEKIVVGISGTDSIIMYLFLEERLKRIPINYSLYPVYVDLGFDGNYTQELIEVLNCLKIPCHVIKTDIGQIAHSNYNRESPCFLCSWNRRKKLFQYSSEVGAQKVALGHHRDDVIVTFLMGLIYSAQISPIHPKQEFFGGKISIIRPLYYVPQEILDRYAKKRNISLPPYPCPSAGKTKRKEVEQLLLMLSQSNGKVKGNIFNAVQKFFETQKFSGF